MAALMWIEVLSRDGEVLARERIAAPEARIGRAFDNDVVVNDPHVAPHHLRVYRGADGVLVAEDLGSVNGLYAEHGAERRARIALAAAPGIRIGRTTLRIHDAAQPVAPEKPLTPPGAHARWGLAFGAGLFALILALNWLELTGEPSVNVVVLPLLGLATALALWTGFWAMLSRLFHGQAQFALNLRIAIAACIAVVLWDQLTEIVSYGLAWREVREYSGLGAWAILAATCYAHLRAIGPRHMQAAMGLVLAVVGAGAAMQYVSRLDTELVVGERATLGELRPPAFRLAPAIDVDAFMAGAEAARIAVDRARLEEPPPGVALSDTE